MQGSNRNLAYLFVGAGLYLAIGHAVTFLTAGALLLALLGLSIVRSSSGGTRRDVSGYVLLLAAGLVLVANHWFFMLGAVAVAAGVFLYRKQPAWPGRGSAAGPFIKQHIAASIQWGHRESWAAHSAELSVAIAEIQIDLTNAFFEEPDITLHLQGIIGDVDIVVPEDIGLTVNAQVTIGEIQVAGERGAGLMNRLVWRSPHAETAQHRVNLNISYIIADVDVKVL